MLFIVFCVLLLFAVYSKKSKTGSPPVPPRTVTLAGSMGSSPNLSRTEKKQGKLSPSSDTRAMLQVENGSKGNMEEVMSVVEREQQLDSLVCSS